MSSNGRAPTIAQRPDKGGVEGRRLQVKTNFFAIPQLPVDTIWHYDVAITPEIPPEKARKLWQVIEELPEIKKFKTVFDGRCNAYSSEELDFDMNVGITRQVALPDPSGAPKSSSSSSSSSSRPRSRNEFTVKMSKVAKIDLGELHDFLNRKGPFTPSCMTALQALNIVLTHKLFSERVSVGRSAFTPERAQNLGGGIEKWDGIFQSIRPGQGRLYANIDVASGAFVKGGNAAGLMPEVLRKRDVEDLRRYGLGSRDFQVLHKHFKACSFTVTHRGASFKKRYKVSEVSMMSAEKITFEQTLNDGGKCHLSIPQYYEKAYGLRLRYPFLPCIGVRGRESTLYFPAEVCVIVPGKRFTRRLNEEQTAEMIKGTCTKPRERLDRIQRNVRELDFNNNAYMREFKLKVNPEMISVPARLIDPPTVEYSNRSMVNPQGGGWQLNPSRKMFKGAELSSWGILVFEDENRFPQYTVQNFVRELTSTLTENGVTVIRREPPIMYAQGNQVERNVDSIWSMIERACHESPQIILVVLPSVCQTYAAIKQYCETSQNGKMTQCVLSNKIKRVNRQYCGMLGLKINAKLGGINNTLAKNSIPFVTEAPTMIIGADVTHPTPGGGGGGRGGRDDGQRSIVAVVGSMDSHGFRYAGRLQLQDSRCEVIEQLKYLVYELIAAFAIRNKIRPSRILFYRDGVSDGQFAQVLEAEVAAVKEACHHMDPNYSPKITFVVVKKRHHARLFPMHPNDGDRSGNCQAGTVVDSVITHPTEFDFYLQSHGGLQGTSRPTLYHVLLDQNNFTSDSLQSLTFRLCHIYSRCPKSVSIVPPVYYAHLLAYRARQYQGREFSDSGSSGSNPEHTFQISDNIKNNMFFV
ncbi:eukaryotic translation initiation factor 2C, 2 [Podila epigama]|nr:eukaryotic translation initiation factor 2C, 2 [Podila epigama]